MNYEKVYDNFITTDFKTEEEFKLKKENIISKLQKKEDKLKEQLLKIQEELVTLSLTKSKVKSY